MLLIVCVLKYDYALITKFVSVNELMEGLKVNVKPDKERDGLVKLLN